MDIDQVKKFNSMIKTLTKKGFIDNSDLAYDMASKICEKGKPPEIPKKEAKETDINKLVEKQVKQQLSTYQKRFENIISNVSEELQKLINNNSKQLEVLKKQLQKGSTEKDVQQKITNEKREHPRQGCYTSEDVALDKIFYYGQK